MTDLISRQAAIKAVTKAEINFVIIADIDFSNYRDTVQEIFNNILGAQMRALESLPSVQPERKKARWILEPYSVENDTWVHRCGECLQFAMIGGGKPLFKYCPNCGAKMEVEE